MLQLMLRKISFYLLLLAFSIPVLVFVSLINQSQKSSVNQTVDAEQSDIQKIIYLDNFPIKDATISSRYGMRKDPFSGKRRMHQGVDIKAKRGTSIYPIGTGKVLFSGRKLGYGKIVEIQHGNTIISRYAHLKKSFVKKNQIVKKEDIIAQVGNTGRSTGPHLHLEVVINSETIDPQMFMVNRLVSSK